MRRALGVTVSVLLLVIVRAGGAQVAPVPADPPAGTGAVSGVVTDAVTGRPVAGASVSLIAFDQTDDMAPRRRAPMLTDTRGRFVFVDLPSTWRFTLWASHPGYSVTDYRDQTGARAGVLAGRDDVMPLRVNDGEWLRDADLRLWRLGAIGGRVIDERGEPVVGVAVRLFSRSFMAGHQRLVPGAVVTTDDRGAYRFAGTEAGSYFVAVLSVQATVPVSAADEPSGLPLGGLQGRGSPPPPVAAGVVRGTSVDVDGRHRLILTNFATPPPPASAQRRTYPPVVHPGARNANDAQPIVITDGTSRLDVDFTLAPVPAATVSGRVSGADGAIEHMLLRLMATGTEHLGFGSEVATTLVEGDGSFTFLNVPAGDYTLMAAPDVAESSGGGGYSDGRLPRPAGYGSVRGLSSVYGSGQPNVVWWRSEAGAGAWGRMPVSVGAGDVTGLDLALRPSVSVRGRLVFDDPEPPGSRFPILFEPANGDPWMGVPNAYTAQDDETYGFEVGGLKAGRYLARLPSFHGRTWRIRSVTAQGIDLTDTGFDGSAGADYDEVIVTLTRTGAELSGFVRDADGRASRGTVVLFPVDPGRWRDYALTPDRLASAPAGPGGAYSFQRMPDGEYHVIAVPTSQSRAWLNPEFLDAAVKRASRVTLAAAAPATRDLTVTEVVVR